MAELIVVDSSGWVAFVSGEANAPRFKEVILDRSKLLIPSITLVEVNRRIHPQSPQVAERVWRWMGSAAVVNLDTEIAQTACALGRQHKLPTADSIIYATSQLHHATLWTQDAHFANLPGVHYLPKPASPRP